MKKRILLSLIVFFTILFNVLGQGIIIDHTCVDVSQIPTQYIDLVKANINMQWCGQSHSNQIPCGLDQLESINPEFDATIQDMVLPVSDGLDVYRGTQGFDAPGQCCTSIMPHAYWESYNGSGVGGGIPPGEVGGAEWTDDLLTYNPTINVSAFMWCWQLEQKNSAYVSAYLAQMELFESYYTNVTFVYTTNNAQAYGDYGLQRAQNNQQIRDYCIANNKVLFDFGDIDSWYNDEQNTTTYNGTTYQVQHNAFDGQDCGHVNLLGAEYKARAIWWMLARLQGWDGNPVIEQPIIIDHTSTNIEEIPLSVIDDIQTNIKYHYCHSSYGRAIRCGLTEIETNPIYDVSISTIDPCTETSCLLPTTPNSLCVLDGQFANGCTCYITPYGYWLGAGGVNWTIETLNENPSLNVSHFTWCAEPEGYSAAQIDDYLSKMEWLETQKPNVTFVYSTCTSQQNGDLGYNRHMRNDQIRNYCIANNKVLFDVEDIQSWYNGVQNYYIYNGEQIPLQHSAYNGSGCNAHMNDLCSLQHGKATWYMMARIRGWNPPTNQSPVIQNQNFSINENAAIGTIIGTVIASDPNPEQTLTYSIIGGNDTVIIDPTTGVLTLNAVVNYETLSVFSIIIKVEDNGVGNLFSEATITLNVLDVNENPVIENQSFSVKIIYNPPYPSTLIPVGKVLAIDPDNNQTLSFSITAGNPTQQFMIESDGDLFYSNISAVSTLENDTVLIISGKDPVKKYPSWIKVYNLTVQVSDNYSPPLTDNAIVKVSINNSLSEIKWWIEGETLYFSFPFTNEDFGKYNIESIYGNSSLTGWCYPGVNQIDISALMPGIYILKITGGETGNVLSTKIIIP